jgi:hypothetical protein
MTLRASDGSGYRMVPPSAVVVAPGINDVVPGQNAVGGCQIVE